MNERQDDREPDEHTRRTENIVLAAVFVLLCAGGAWLLLTLADLRKTQDCLSQGRRNCGEVIRTDRSPQ